MLYIITSRAANRRQTGGAKIIAAEDVELAPSLSLKQSFELGWNRYPKPSDDDRRCDYERYRRVLRKTINNPA